MAEQVSDEVGRLIVGPLVVADVRDHACVHGTFRKGQDDAAVVGSRGEETVAHLCWQRGSDLLHHMWIEDEPAAAGYA